MAALRKGHEWVMITLFMIAFPFQSFGQCATGLSYRNGMLYINNGDTIRDSSAVPEVIGYEQVFLTHSNGQYVLHFGAAGTAAIDLLIGIEQEKIVAYRYLQYSSCQTCEHPTVQICKLVAKVELHYFLRHDLFDFIQKKGNCKVLHKEVNMRHIYDVFYA